AYLSDGQPGVPTPHGLDGVSERPERHDLVVPKQDNVSFATLPVLKESLRPVSRPDPSEEKPEPEIPAEILARHRA
ncbi:MAG: hypothetical protein WB586_03910, partial [Chthoniobacterales bacterium]